MMEARMRAKLVGALVGSLFLLPVGATAQTASGATDLDHTEIEAQVQRSAQEGLSDQILSLVDVGPYSVAAAVVIRRPPGGPGKAIGNIGRFSRHDKITEVYYVLSGSGVQMTGGTMIGGNPSSGGSTVGPGAGGATRLEGGTASNLEAGDVQIIPAGVPHGWLSVGPQGIDYLVIRVDPEHVLAK
jgi:mannose-6-phosphate isomerase-like protein (cupin superfamily)